jgi:hypothetical protein
MWTLLDRRVGSLRGLGLGSTALRALIGATGMGAVVYGATLGIHRLIPLDGRAGWALIVLAGGGLGLAVYLAICALLKVTEISMIAGLLRQVVRRLRS